jgi:PAS domain S-box-containing protein
MPDLPPLSDRPEVAARGSWRQWAWIAVLGAAAAAVNLHAPTVFFDSQIMLGGSLSVFALLQFGWPGLAVGVAALSATALRWGHPYELLIGTAFLVWLKIFLDRFNGGWSNRDNGRIVPAAAVFWLVAGLPLEVFLFALNFDLPTSQALGIGLKESVTGLLNTTLGLLAFLAVRWRTSVDRPGSFSIRGLTFAAILSAISIPGLVLIFGLSHQVKITVLEEQFLALRFHGDRAADLADLGASEALEALAREDGDKQFLLRRADGSTLSSDLALFERLRQNYEIESPSRTGRVELGIYRPISGAPVILTDADSYWFATYDRPGGKSKGGVVSVTVVETPPEIVRLLDYQLLLPSFSILLAVLLLGTMVASLAGRGAERQFKSVIDPLQSHAPDQAMPRLSHSKIRELDAIVSAVNERSRLLAQSEQRYRNFFNLPFVGTAITSRTKGWVEVNNATCEILGYPREELFQKNWAELTHPDDLAADEAQFARMLRREIDGYELEKRFIRKDGSVVYTLLSGGCGPIGDKTPDLFYVNILDITERKKAEKKLHDALMSMPLPVACGSNDEPPAITLLNKAFTETFGYTREDLPTVQTWFEAAYPDPAYRAKVLTRWQESVARGQREEGSVGVQEVRIRCKDGSVRDAILSATLMEDGPIVAFQDISQRKQLEEELTAAREREKQAEQEMRAMLEKKLKTSLNAAAVAHEINQPLSRILLRARMNLDKEASTDKDTLRALIADAERVVDTIEKMKVLLRNVETVQKPVDLAQVVRSSLHQLKQPLRSARVKVTHTGPERDCLVLGDDVQLQMIITNLVRNAIEAIDGAGSQNREVSIARILHEETVELVIGDSGPGWPGGTLDEMLLRTTKREGAGIGLYVVKTAMENHRGQISIGASPLGGAELRVVFPRES